MTGAICLAAGLLAVPLGEAITLRWTHSIEKIAWEEDYRLQAGALHLTEARIRGSGAGMEPPPGAVLRGGWYEFAPASRELAELPLRRSPYAADYELCADGGCRPLSALLPSDGGVTRLTACRAPG